MKVFIMFSADRMFKPRLLMQILLLSQYEICGVAEVSNHRRSQKRWSNFRQQLSFWGLKGTFFLGLESIFRKMLSSLPLPAHWKNFSSIKQVCRIFGIDHAYVTNVNDPQFLESLNVLKPDVILSFQHQIFQSELLSIPNIACINCHPAALPNYRGVKPIFWAMADDQDTVGVTVHTMTPEIDKGQIITQKTFALRKDSTLLENYRLAYETAAFAILEALEKIEQNDRETFITIPANAAYYRSPTSEVVKKFYRQGKRVA